MGVESYKHQFAKNVLATWFRDKCKDVGNVWVSLQPACWRVNRDGPHYGVWVEYPVCLDKQNQLIGTCPVWDEHDPEFELAPPSYQRCIDLGYLPIAIFDVAIQHKGNIIYAFEVVHKNRVSPLKLDYIERVRQYQHLEVFEIDADWILSRVGPPDALICEYV